MASRDGTKLAYASHGETGTPLVFVHGWMVSGQVWSDLEPSLRAARQRYVIPDLRGAGASSPAATDYSLERYVDDVAAVIGDVAKSGRVVLVGHSMGGQVAQLVAARCPETVAGLVLVSPVPVDGLPMPEDAVGLFRSAAHSGEARAQIMALASPNLAPDRCRRILADAAGVDGRCLLDGFETWRFGTSADVLRDVRARTLVVASDDAFLPPEFLRAKVVERLSGARLAHLPGAGHYIPSEQPAQLAAVIQAFLAEISDAQPG